MTIGGTSPTHTPDTWNGLSGQMDEVRFWGVDKSATLADDMNFAIEDPTIEYDLKGYYTDAENGDVVVKDSSQYGNHALTVNALTLDGVDDYISVTGPGSMDAITYEAWINPDNITGEDVIVSKGGATGTRFSVSNGYLQLMVNGATLYNSTAQVTAGEWTHVAVTYDPAGDTLQFFFDGINEPAQTGLVTGTVNSSTSLEIGAGGNADHFGGELMDVRVWNDVREGWEIGQHMGSDPHSDDGSLVAYYKLNDGVGADVADYSGNEYDGTLNGQTVDAETWVNTAPLAIEQRNVADMDGSTDGILVANSADFDGIATSMTVEAWVNFDRDTGANQTIAAKYGTSDARAFSLFAANDTGDGNAFKLATNISPDGTNGAAFGDLWGDTVLEADTWYHVAMTYDGSFVRMYVNGQLDAEVAYSSGVDVNTAPVGLGASYQVGVTPSNVLDGQLANAAIWTRALTPAELRHDMAEGMPDDGTGIVGLWPLTEGNGAVATDVSGNGNNGTFEDSTSWTNNSPPVYGIVPVETPAGVPITDQLALVDDEGDVIHDAVLDGTDGGALYGTVTGSKSGDFFDFTYTPDAGFSGVDSFYVKTTDTDASGNVAYSKVTVHVGC